MKKIKNIHVRGRRWFDKANGNTYCATKVIIDDKHVLTTDWTYGYEEFYIQLANEELNKLGLIDTTTDSPSGLNTPLWRYCSENDISFSYDVTDGLKRDLVAFSQDKPE